mmetsp:Transcript_36747/g.104590  ORF Transcript_36747/g.104590 Transcript_36747/m.104590 type:complete len:205 (-) Transcript_36747:527-1141(-)
MPEPSRLRGHPRTTAGDRRRDVELGAVVRVKRYGGNLGAEVDAREAAKDGERCCRLAQAPRHAGEHVPHVAWGHLVHVLGRIATLLASANDKGVDAAMLEVLQHVVVPADVVSAMSGEQRQQAIDQAPLRPIRACAPNRIVPRGPEVVRSALGELSLQPRPLRLSYGLAEVTAAASTVTATDESELLVDEPLILRTVPAEDDRV